MARCVHEACAARDHDVLGLRQRLKLCAANEHGRIFPDAVVFEEAGMTAVGACRSTDATRVSIKARDNGEPAKTYRSDTEGSLW